VNGSDIFLSDIHKVMTLPVLVVFRVSNCCFLIDMHKSPAIIHVNFVI
jgi:hypothetical protein